jgi:hypothetical protein
MAINDVVQRRGLRARRHRLKVAQQERPARRRVLASGTAGCDRDRDATGRRDQRRHYQRLK